jgi:hypothetical protein
VGSSAQNSGGRIEAQRNPGCGRIGDNRKGRSAMGDKGKRDKDKGKKQKSKQHEQEEKKKQDKQPKKIVK